MEGLGALLIVIGILLVIAVWTDTGTEIAKAVFG
jgi:hypothetical protein